MNENNGNSHTNGKPAKGFPPISHDTRLLASRLERLKPGETITYAEIFAGMEMEISDQVARGRLASARRIVERERGMVIHAVRNVGLRRLPADEIPSIGEEALKHVGKTTRNAQKRMYQATANEELDNETRIRINTSAAILGTISAFCKPKRIEAVRNEVKNAAEHQVSSRKVLEHFK